MPTGIERWFAALEPQIGPGQPQAQPGERQDPQGFRGVRVHRPAIPHLRPRPDTTGRIFFRFPCYCHNTRSNTTCDPPTDTQPSKPQR